MDEAHEQVGLAEQLSAWVGRGFITNEQAEQILTAESAGAHADKTEHPASEAEPQPLQPVVPAAATSAGGSRMIPAVFEVLAYFGAVLLIAAIIAFIAPSLKNIGTAATITLTTTLTVVLVVIGLLLAVRKTDQVRRLGNVLMFIGILASLAMFGSITGTFLKDANSVRLSFAVSAVLSAVLWLKHKTSLQLLALVFTVTTLISVVASEWLFTPGTTLVGWILLIVGCLCALTAEIDWLRPRNAGWSLACLEILVGLQLMAVQDWRGRVATLIGGCAAAIILLFVGLWRKRGVPLGLGAAGIIVFIPQTVSCALTGVVDTRYIVLIDGLIVIAISALIAFFIFIRPRQKAARIGGAQAEADQFEDAAAG